MRAHPLRALLGLAAALSAPVAAHAVSIEDPGQGAVAVEPGDTGAAHLSGITWAGGERYYAVSDRGGRLFPIEIAIDPATGTVRRAALAKPVRLARAVDLEGIVMGSDGTVRVSDERGPAIREHRVSDGAVVSELALPPVFAKARLNLSLESLSREGATLWTANEETLSVDGPSSTGVEGSVIRLQRFGADGSPAGQWAYRTDPWPGNALGGLEGSGVVDVLALPGDELIVLERAFSDQGFRSRIYAVDRSGATDTSGIPMLTQAEYQPVAKKLLWENRALSLDFEGWTLGPTLDDGSTSLVLVADDAGLTVPHLYALRLRRSAQAAGAGDPGGR